ncbi:OsmC family protein [Bacillus massiliigorillae]|uniref:OsmC family protein n=1 Tax=Bacillus massiliigorillae TaxID=1243664 RepID=UPI0003A1CA1C|nr:OsmC family protein [Bacillus massiliigorillae]
MTTIIHRNNQAKIANQEGVQVVGTNAPNLNGLNPKELLEASVGLCTSITLQKILERDGHKVDSSTITIDVEALKGENVTNRFTNFDIKVTLPDELDEAYKRKLLVLVERGCTISNTLKGTATVELLEVSKATSVNI